MAKAAGSYSSIIRGVSQQVPAQRLEGQMGSQINFIADPVVGLTRRHGTQWLMDQIVDDAANSLEKMLSAKSFEFRQDNADYTVMFSTLPGGTNNAYLQAYDKGARRLMPIRANPGDWAGIMASLSNGVSAATQIGNYLLFAIRNQNTQASQYPAPRREDRAVVWFKNTTYNRTYTVTSVINGVSRVVSYVTPSSTYPGTLDTSDIQATINGQPNPNYAKEINDRINAYNSAVTQWIRTSAAESTPRYVAQQLVNRMNAANWPGQRGVNHDSGSTIWIIAPGITSLSTGDGASEDSAFALLDYVYDVGELPPYCWGGKRVEVRARDSSDVFYMQAQVDGDYGKARWIETTVDHGFLGALWIIGTIHEGNLVLATSPTVMRSLVPGADLPEYSQRTVGDENSAPMPHFAGRPITYLTTFQDRLLVVSGNTVSLSAAGDYFRFFPESVVTVQDSDPFELQAAGAEYDVIRASVRFDKSLILFGESNQYALDGRSVATPSNSALVQISSHEDTVDADPILAGDLVFFARRRDGITRISQMSFGSVADSLRADEITVPLKDWIRGNPLQLMGVTSPNYIVARTNWDRSSIYLYRYVDNEGERILQSWFQFKYPQEMGSIIGMTTFEDEIVLFFANSIYGRRYVSAYRQSLSVSVSPLPYLDAMRPYMWFIGLHNPSTQMWRGEGFLQCAVDNRSQYYLHGEGVAFDPTRSPTDPGYAVGYNRLNEDFVVPLENLWAGVSFDAEVELTSPFMRDDNGVAITTGRLTIGRLDLSFTETAGFNVDVNTRRGNKRALNYGGRMFSTFETDIYINLNRGSIPVFIGRESREYTATIRSMQWRPVNITSVEYTGQSFGG